MPEPRVAGQVVADDLHGGLLALRGAAQVHPAHPALAEAAEQAVPPDAVRVTGLEGVHGASLLSRPALSAVRLRRRGSVITGAGVRPEVRGRGFEDTFEP
ncbi:hypothetical protein GCM10017691_29640 [Pseudonocardia petroleophila]